MSVTLEELVTAARNGCLANPNLAVSRREPLVLPQFDNTSDPGEIGTMRELNRVSQPSEMWISSFDKRTGTVAAMAADLSRPGRERTLNRCGIRY
jgi:hypothetical protein